MTGLVTTDEDGAFVLSDCSFVSVSEEPDAQHVNIIVRHKSRADRSNIFFIHGVSFHAVFRDRVSDNGIHRFKEHRSKIFA